MYWSKAFFNDLLPKIDIRFVHSKSIEPSGKYFEGWYWVLFLTEGSFGSILMDENGEVIPLLTEVDKKFSGVDGVFKQSVDK